MTTENATRKVRIVLSALTRVEYMEVLEVPASMSDQELDKLVEDRYADVDGGEFQPDPDYWEQGTCYYENARAEDSVSGRLEGNAVVDLEVSPG